jgi:hypothetical protein
MAPSRISLVLLKGLLTSRQWRHGVGIVGSLSGGWYSQIKGAR